jgi:adenosylhomocysteine nucleosidase
MKKHVWISLFLLAAGSASAQAKLNYAIIISANMEWKEVKKIFPNEYFSSSPWGEYFFKEIEKEKVLFFHEGWGKVAAAGATQYVIDQFHPAILINLGTCGGFEGEVKQGDVILADRTIIYDIVEAMGDSKEAIADYATEIDLSWLGGSFPVTAKRSVLVSADRDLRPEEIDFLRKEYHAMAGDWESGAIAYTARRNHKKVIILRGVTDIVGKKTGEAYGNVNLFAERTEGVMKHLFGELPTLIRYLSDLPH